MTGILLDWLRLYIWYTVIVTVSFSLVKVLGLMLPIDVLDTVSYMIALVSPYLSEFTIIIFFQSLTVILSLRLVNFFATYFKS